MSRPIATVRAEQGYDGMHAAFRARFEALGLTRAQVDERAGWNDGHAGKAFAPYPIRALGRQTLRGALVAAAWDILFVERADLMERFADSGAKRKRRTGCMKPVQEGIANLPEVRALKRKVLSEAMSANGKKGGVKSGQSRRTNGTKIPRHKRRAIARRAASARWNKP